MPAEREEFLPSPVGDLDPLKCPLKMQSRWEWGRLDSPGAEQMFSEMRMLGDRRLRNIPERMGAQQCRHTEVSH